MKIMFILLLKRGGLVAVSLIKKGFAQSLILITFPSKIIDGAGRNR